MRRQSVILWLILFILPVSCSLSNERNKTSGEEDKLQYNPRLNEVEVITLKREDFPLQLISNGKVQAVAKAGLSFRIDGPIASIRVRNGQVITKGTILATLDRPDLKMALDAAEIACRRAELNLFDNLVGQGYPARDTSSVPANILEDAKILSGYSSAQNVLDRARLDWESIQLKAPFRGRIAEMNASIGENLGSNFFCSLLDDSSFDVVFSVMETENAFLKEGLPVEIIPYAIDSWSCRGVISGINPLVDKNGQIQIRAHIKGDSRLLDGMNVRVQVERSLPGQFVVPRSAVVIRDNMDVLFTYTDDGIAHWTYVEIVASNNTSHAVRANTNRGSVLREGERVIISGNLNLADGSETTLRE